MTELLKLRWLTLHPFDREVIEYMLDRDGQMYDELRSQLPFVKTFFRYVGGLGYFAKFVVTGAKPISGLSNAVIMDVDGRSAEISSEVGFILYVRDGMLDVLEGHTYGGEDWPKHEAGIELYSEFFVRRDP